MTIVDAKALQVPTTDCGQDDPSITALLAELSALLDDAAAPAVLNVAFSRLLDKAEQYFAAVEATLQQTAAPGRIWQQFLHRGLLTEMRLARAAGSPLRAAPDPPLLQRLGILLERSDSGQADPAGAAARMALFKDMVGQLHPADLQLALPDLDQPDRLDIFTRLPTELAAATLEQLDAGTQRQLVAGLGAERAADLIDFMTPGPAAAVLRNLLPSASWVILQRLGPVRARKIIALVQGRDGDGLGNLLTLRYLRAGPETGCGLLLQRYRSLAAETRAWRYIYVVAADGRLLGIGDLRDVLVAQPDVVLADIMTVNVVTLQDSDSVASAVQLFQHYGFSALPVVSMEGVLTGVLLRQDCLAVATRAHI